MRGPDLLGGGAAREVDDLGSAEVAEMVGDLRGGGGEDAGAAVGRELDRGLANPAGCAVDEKHASRVQLGGFDCMVGGEACSGQRCSDGERKALGDACDLPVLGDQGIFSVRASAPCDVHELAVRRITRHELGHARADAAGTGASRCAPEPTETPPEPCSSLTVSSRSPRNPTSQRQGRNCRLLWPRSALAPTSPPACSPPDPTTADAASAASSDGVPVRWNPVQAQLG